MEQAEVEILVGELETRMERLRSLYDMYFMGIEKLEPLVPKKDVERRMQVLRKEQIRNTGLRFKFQMILQRFATYQTHWLRISRQIEQGTYGRDVRRAAARFGVDPTKERATREQPPEPEAEAEAEREEPRVFELPEELEPESGDASLLLPLDEDVEDDPFAQIAPPAAPVPPPAPSVGRTRDRFASSTRFELDDMADPFEEADPFPKPAGSPSGPKLRIAPRPGASKAPPAPEEHRDTERRIPIARSFAPSPPSAPIDPADQGPGSLRAAQVARPNEQRVVIAKRASLPDEVEKGPPPADVPPRRPGTLPSAGVVFTRSVPIPASPPSAPGPAAPRVPAGLPSSSPMKAAATSPSSKGPVVLPASAPRIPAAPPSKPAVSRPAAPAPQPPSAQPASPPRAAPLSAVAAPPSAAAASRALPQRPAPAPAPAPKPAAPAPTVGDMSGDRFGEIFSKYVETRQKHNEPTHAITRDALAKQLAESTQRLKQKHGAKAIDFEVVVKDGKTILRPVVK